MKALCSILNRIFSQIVRILLGTTYTPGEKPEKPVQVQVRTQPVAATPKPKRERVKAPKKAKKSEGSALLRASSL